MNISLVITVLGPDRPGLVSALAARASACGANWMESNMAQLAGSFAGIVRLEIAAAKAQALETSLRELATDGLHLTIARGTEPAGGAVGRGAHIELLGNDRPGIVSEISAVLARLGASIDRIETRCEDASFSGDPMFRAQIDLQLPADVSLAALRDAIEALANELMVDIKLQDSVAA